MQTAMQYWICSLSLDCLKAPGTPGSFFYIAAGGLSDYDDAREQKVFIA